MIFNLVIKDFILIKKYLIFLFAFVVIAPIYVSSSFDFHDGGLTSTLLTILLVAYAMFSTVSKLEDKYKGGALLCATPYTRNAFVKAKYLFVFVIYLGIIIIHVTTSIIVPSMVGQQLNTNSLGMTFLIVTVLFGTLIPLQFKYGFDKTRIISFFTIFCTPFVFPAIIRIIQTNHATFSVPFPHIIDMLIIWFLSLVIGFVSMVMSLKIYAKRDL